jgi:hypothetical protein
MAVHLFKRYVWLLDLISQGGKTYEDIDRAWRNNYRLNNNKEFLPKRTLHNHITAIKEMFDIEIECRKQGGYKYVLKGSLDGTLSEAQEALLSQLRLSNLQMNISSHPFLVLPTLRVNQYVTELSEAIAKGKKIKLLWGWEDVPYKWIQVTPYYVRGYNALCSKGVNWYLFGVIEDGTISVYDLDCIRDFEVLEESFQHPQMPLSELEEYLEKSPANDQDDSFGMCLDALHDARQSKI